MKPLYRLFSYLPAILLLFLYQFISGQGTDFKAPVKNIIILMDNSGSMKSNDPDFLTKNIVKSFLEKTDSATRVALLLFDTNARLIFPLKSLADSGTRNKAIASLDRIDFKGKYTNIPVAVERAIYELINACGKEERKSIILLTDGYVDTGNPEENRIKSDWLRSSLAKEAKDNNISVYGIAFTEKADFQLLQELAQITNGKYFRALHVSDIEPVFNKIQEAVNGAEEGILPEEKEMKDTEKTEPDGEKLTVFYILALVVVLIAGLTGFIFFSRKRKNRHPEKYKRKPSGQNATIILDESVMPFAWFVDHGKVSGSEHFDMDKSMILIGRDDTNDLRIDRKNISACHASFKFKNRMFYLTDNHSTNGTSINGKTLKPGIAYKVEHGNEIMFDKCRFTFLTRSRSPKTVIIQEGNEDNNKPVSGKETLVMEDTARDEAVIDKGAPTGDGSDVVAPPAGAEGITGEYSPAAENRPSDFSDKNKTRIIQNFCPNHPGSRATEMCPRCKGAFCKECMVEIKGSVAVCKKCYDAAFIL